MIFVSLFHSNAVLYLAIYYAIHNTSAQNLSKINAMINPLVVESLTVNDTTRRRNILSV
jgi:hypothetical protein